MLNNSRQSLDLLQQIAFESGLADDIGINLNQYGADKLSTSAANTNYCQYFNTQAQTLSQKAPAFVQSISL